MATRRPLTDTQRNINSAARAHKRMQADRTEAEAARETFHSQTRVSTESQLASGSRNRHMQGAVASKTVSTLTPSSDSNLFMTTVFLIGGLALVYQLVTKAGPASTSTLVTSLGDLLHKVSSTTPLFQVTPKTTP